METWQKLVLDPAHHAVLNNLEEKERKQKLAEETGLRTGRCQKILQNLMQEELVEYEVEEGVRTFHRKAGDERLDELRDELKSETIGGTREAVENGEYDEARNHLTQTLPVEGETRSKVARLEVAEKLAGL
ncbi:MAG: hypothetical protein ABEK16_04410 [Candidatus Nanohalobium sp.]